MRFPAGYFEHRRKTWRKAFAIWPVRIHDSWVWLEWYWFRGDIVSCDRARTEEEKSNPYSLVSY